MATLKHYVFDDKTREELERFTSADVSTKHISAFDIVDRFPEIHIPFGDFLSMLPPMRVRQYSISSSPLEDPGSVALTYGVVNQEAGIGGKRYLGIAPNYMSELRKGDRVHVAVRASNRAFHPPLDVQNVPVLMACTGAGLAPFRGFVQERAAQIRAGRRLAPAILFVGCRHPQRDALYADQFQQWAEMGAVDVRYAYSREPDSSHGCRYVQERLWRDREDARALWAKGARIFVCGNREVGDAVKDTVIRSFLEWRKEKGKESTMEAAEEWFKGIKNERFASDVFA